jgi:CrcB protein
MLRSVLLVGAGGAAGSMLRYVVGAVVNRYFSHPFPLGTFLINVVGSFIIGLLFGLIGRQQISGAMWFLLASGFCGGFTTFSTFALDNINLMQKSQSLTAIIYMGLSVIIGLLLCRLGIWLVS